MNSSFITFQVILAGTLTGVQGDSHSLHSFGSPFHSKITWAGIVLTEDCSRRNCVLVMHSFLK